MDKIIEALFHVWPLKQLRQRIHIQQLAQLLKKKLFTSDLNLITSANDGTIFFELEFIVEIRTLFFKGSHRRCNTHG